MPPSLYGTLKGWCSMPTSSGKEHYDARPIVLHPSYADVLEDAERAGLIGSPERYFNTSLAGFPKAFNKGKTPTSYGIACDVSSVSALLSLIELLGYAGGVPVPATDGGRANPPLDAHAAIEGEFTPARRATLTEAERLALAGATAELAAEVPSIGLEETTRSALVQARIGHGAFRDQMMEIWGWRCAVTGCGIQPTLIASHALAWRDCKDGSERLDPYNGLLLTASIDRLFDQGLTRTRRFLPSRSACRPPAWCCGPSPGR